jgi:hypothetical protein
LVNASLTFLVAAIVASGPSPPSSPRPFNIPAQPLEDALQAFSSQSGLQLLFSAEVVALGRMSPGISGVHASHEALDVLVGSSDLRYEYVNDRTVTISRRRAWRRDQDIFFDDAPLGEIVSVFNGANARQIHLRGAELSALRLTGHLRAGNLDALVWSIQHHYSIKVRKSRNTVTIAPRR